MTEMPEIPLRNGYSIQESDTVRTSVLENLRAKNFISLSKDEIVTCKKCGWHFVVDAEFIRRGSRVCPICQKTITTPKNTTYQSRVTSVNYKQIIKSLDKNLRAIFGDSNLTLDKTGRYWILNEKEKQSLLSIYGVSATTSFFSIANDEGIVFYLDSESIKPILNNFNKARFVYFDSPLITDSKGLRDLLNSLDHSNTLKYLELKTAFESYILKVGPEYFEKTWAPLFIDSIKTKNENLRQLYARLQTIKDTIINTKFVNIGGPGQPDFFLINTFEYLQAGLKPEKYGEMKCYTKSEFTMEDFGKALGHAVSNDTLSIVSSDEIHPMVWSKIFEFKNQEKYYKHVIIDKDLILFLIYNLELRELIQ